MTAQPDPGSVFVDYRSYRRRWLTVLAIAAVTVLLVTVGYTLRTTISSPDSAVRAYFDALADRDAAAVLSTVAPEVAQVDRDAINDAVLTSESYRPPRQVSTGEVTVSGDSAVVAVTYRIEERGYEASLRLRRADGLADRVLPRWLVVDAIGTIVLGEAPDEVMLNGQRLAGHADDGPRVLAALPGGYQLGVPDDDPVWEPRTVPVRVEPQRATEVDVVMAVRPQARQDVERRVESLLEDCAASTELMPPGCPFGYAVLAQAEDVQWRITRLPALAVSAGRELGEPVLLVETTREGEAVVTGSRADGDRFEATVPFPVSGVAVPRAGSVIFQPGW